MPVWLQTALLLTLSNVFMTFAWYGHLKTLNTKPWIIAALISWGIALFEYLLQVPANRIGYTALSVGQLKIMQEVITLAVFVPFSVYFMQQPLKLDYLWAGLCLLLYLPRLRPVMRGAPVMATDRARVHFGGSRRVIRLEVSQRPPPSAWISP